MNSPDPSSHAGTNYSRIPGRQFVVGLAVVAAVLIAATIWFVAIRQPSDAPQMSDAATTEVFEYDYVIPAGTQDRIDAGETVEVVPAELTVKVGQSIRIVNDDDSNHVVGTFFVPAGATLRQHFNTPGELIGECDVHPSGRFRLVVEP